MTDPCWYAVPNATGKEVIIFELSSGTEKTLLAKQILAHTETGAPVRVMCNSSDVSTDFIHVFSDTSSCQVTGDVGFICQNGLFKPTKAGE